MRAQNAAGRLPFIGGFAIINDLINPFQGMAHEMRDSGLNGGFREGCIDGISGAFQAIHSLPDLHHHLAKALSKKNIVQRCRSIFKAFNDLFLVLNLTFGQPS